MGFNPRRPKPQTVRALAALPAPAETFDPSPTTMNVANAAQVELLIRYLRSADALVGNELVMRIQVINEQGDALVYRRTIDDGGSIADSTNLQGKTTEVDSAIKLFPFVGVANGVEVRETYIIQVGPATAMSFAFAEAGQGATPSQLAVFALYLLE